MYKEDGRGHNMKSRLHHMIIVDAHGWPDKPIGVIDMAELQGSAPETIKKQMRHGDTVYGLPVIDLGKRPVQVNRTCIRCGAVIGNLQCSSYCNACRDDNRAKGRARRAKRQEPKKEADDSLKIRHEVPYDQKSKLARIAWEARQAGMSYGQYTGLKKAGWSH